MRAERRESRIKTTLNERRLKENEKNLLCHNKELPMKIGHMCGQSKVELVVTSERKVI